MAELRAHTVGLSLGGVGVVFSLVCALFVLVAPGAAIVLFGSIFHGVDFTAIVKTTLGFGDIILGLVVVFVLGYLAGALYAYFYNTLTKR